MAIARRLPCLQAVPVPTVDGAVLYLDLRVPSTHGLLAGLTCEPNEQDVMRRLIRPGDVVFDIGAHIGLHLVLLSQLVGSDGRVFAFEPNPAVLPALKQTIGDLTNAELFCHALSDKSGSSELFVPADQSMASLTNWTKGVAKSKTRVVPCSIHTLDEMIANSSLTRPDFIKCDVEGAELLVFNGAQNVLNNPSAPIIMFEVNELATSSFGYSAISTMDFLRSLPVPRYQFLKIQSRGELVREWEQSSEVYNMIAFPQSRIARLVNVIELDGQSHTV